MSPKKILLEKFFGIKIMENLQESESGKNFIEKNFQILRERE